jgi:hypothetical protein
MYGNLSNMRRVLMTDISENKVKLPDEYDFAYDSKKAEQLGMFHFGG